jgi:hypothetical protein
MQTTLHEEASQLSGAVCLFEHDLQQPIKGGLARAPPASQPLKRNLLSPPPISLCCAVSIKSTTAADVRVKTHLP